MWRYWWHWPQNTADKSFQSGMKIIIHWDLFHILINNQQWCIEEISVLTWRSFSNDCTLFSLLCICTREQWLNKHTNEWNYARITWWISINQNSPNNFIKCKISYPSCVESVSFLPWPEDIVWIGVINWGRRLLPEGEKHRDRNKQ